MLVALTHYGRAPVPVVMSTPRHRQSVAFKPKGFWVSVDAAGQGWAEFCRAGSFELQDLEAVHDVILAANARVLLISTTHGFDDFADEFGVRSEFDPQEVDRINWRAVADRYQGIIIAPYRWDRRLDGGIWYYGWDCASGCIWDADAVASITIRQAVEEAA